MDEWMKESLDTLVFSTSLQLFLCYRALFGLPHCNTVLHFVFDNTLPRSANRLLIPALFPCARMHCNQNRWCRTKKKKKIELVAERRPVSLSLPLSDHELLSSLPTEEPERESHTSVYVIEINT